jgi:sugar/nucleoside kinase (ribokinase family)
MSTHGITVFGDLNLDTSVSIPSFPLHVGDTMFSIDGSSDVIGGAAANVAAGLAALGHSVRFGACIGQDDLGDVVLERVRRLGLGTDFIRRDWPTTSRTVVLIDAQGNRLCINDPKRVNVYRYPDEHVDAVVGQSEWVFVSTQNWCRHVARRAKLMGRKVAVDVQALVDDEEYFRDFLALADVVVLSTERLAMHSHDFIRKLWANTGVQVVAATHGAHGATLGVRGQDFHHEPAHDVRPIVDKTGAGDAFTAGFLGALVQGRTPREALTLGQLTAAWKIGDKGSTRGFPSPEQLRGLFASATGARATS